MRALVTGAAGFIGSTLGERLARDGWDVVAVDNFNSYYDEALKRRNARELQLAGRVQLFEADLMVCDLKSLFDGVDVVFHLAGQPGVRMSWTSGFESYLSSNVAVTQRLLEFARDRQLQRFVFASSSSVYGERAPYPSVETDLTVPYSPYGVTKLAAELLTRAYAANFGMPVVALRYFTVYGPRQRPDMAFSLLLDRVERGEPFALFGDGSQVRDFTYVDDVVEANVLAACVDVEPGSVFNVAGGSSISMSEVVELVESVTGRSVLVEHHPERAGDVHRTGGDTGRAAEHLGWRASVSTSEGLRRQWEWRRSHQGG